MKASEIVDKLKSVLLSAEEPQVEAAEEQVEELELSAEQVEEIEVNEPVVLAEDGEEPSEEVAEEAPEEMKYATKQELESAVAEMRAMYEAIVEKMGSEDMETEIPAEELSKEDQVDLSADEPAAEPLTHSPEVEEAQKLNFFKASRAQNTASIVYQRMFNK